MSLVTADRDAGKYVAKNVANGVKGAARPAGKLGKQFDHSAVGKGVNRMANGFKSQFSQKHQQERAKAIQRKMRIVAKHGRDNIIKASHTKNPAKRTLYNAKAGADFAKLVGLKDQQTSAHVDSKFDGAGKSVAKKTGISKVAGAVSHQYQTMRGNTMQSSKFYTHIHNPIARKRRKREFMSHVKSHRQDYNIPTKTTKVNGVTKKTPQFQQAVEKPAQEIAQERKTAKLSKSDSEPKPKRDYAHGKPFSKKLQKEGPGAEFQAVAKAVKRDKHKGHHKHHEKSHSKHKDYGMKAPGAGINNTYSQQVGQQTQQAEQPVANSQPTQGGPGLD